jgi:streptogramin lyase
MSGGPVVFHSFLRTNPEDSESSSRVSSALLSFIHNPQPQTKKWRAWRTVGFKLSTYLLRVFVEGFVMSFDTGSGSYKIR